MAGTGCLCDACFTEYYPTAVPEDAGKSRFELPLQDPELPPQEKETL